MTEPEKIEQLRADFYQLCDEGKHYVLAIAEALLFAQDSILEQQNNANAKKGSKISGNEPHK